MENAVTDQLQIANEHYHTHQVNEDLNTNESHLSPQDDYFSEVDVAHVVLTNHLIFKLIKLVNQNLVLGSLQIVSVNIHNQLEHGLRQTELVLDLSPFDVSA